MYNSDQFSLLLSSLGFKKNTITNAKNFLGFFSFKLGLETALWAKVYKTKCTFEISCIDECVVLPTIYYGDIYDFYEYMINLLTVHEVQNAREEMAMDVENWLETFKGDYTFKKFTESVLIENECCFNYTINTELKNNKLLRNDVVILEYNPNINEIKIVLDFEHTSFHGCVIENFNSINSFEDFLDTHVVNVQQVNAFRRKQILDSVLKDVL